MEYFDRIRMTREDKDETQRDIARVLQIKQPQYLRYETGKNEIPLKYLIALCQHYHVSADYILGLPKGLDWPR